ncbi:MAG TPA: hypothetical protein VHD32_11755 [Candidatus Didemnitutus sp.]|nr:hypothetical protein [Candidatus Didemnitutus sp.]
MKRVLIISPHFPPVNAPDGQRARMSLPYYRRFGWEPEVLAVGPEHQPEWRDDSMLASLPPDVPIHTCGALPLRLTRLVGVQNLGLRSAPFINRAALHLLLTRSFDLIFFTTTQYMVTPLSLLWRRRGRVPYVIDLQDPWRSDYYRRPGAPPPPGGWKYQFARFTAWLFEERTFRAAAGFVSVSPRYFQELAARYAWFRDRPQVVIPFGGPSADFAHLRTQPPCSPPWPDDGRKNWVAPGSLSPSFSHALRVLFSGLRRLRDSDPVAAARLRFHFVGTSYATGSRARETARPIAAAYGVADLVEEQCRRIGYLDSLRLMEQADGLLLLGSDDPGYSPSKLHPYIMARRPVLTLAHHGSVLADLVTRLDMAPVIRLLVPGRLAAPPREVADFLSRAAGPDGIPSGSRDDATFDREFTAEAGARRQCAFFDSLLTTRA